MGTRPHALRYINQFTEIFTEEGRKSVKITHRVPNHEPRITYTPGLVRERMNNDKAAALLRLQQQQQQQQAQRQQQQQIQVANAAVAAASAASIGIPLANNGPVSHPAVLQKKTTSLPNATPPASAAAQAQGSPSILQQQLCTPPPASAQLPLHPLPLRSTNGSAAPPGPPGPPTNILQVYCACKVGPLSRKFIVKCLWIIFLQNFKRQLMVCLNVHPMPSRPCTRPRPAAAAVWPAKRKLTAAAYFGR